MIKAVLLIGGKRYNVTDDLRNWDDVEISAKRKGLGGVIRAFSNKFEFVKGAYELIENEYLTNYLKASAVLIIGVLNDSWSYNEKFRCNLDFSSYESDGYVISINSIDDSVASVINANKSQIYDIPVSELSPSSLYYDRMDLNNEAEWSVNPSEDQAEEGVYEIVIDRTQGMSSFFPLVYKTDNFPVKNIIAVSDQLLNINDFHGDYYMVKGISAYPVNLKVSFNILAHRPNDSRVALSLFFVILKNGERVNVLSEFRFNEWDKYYYINKNYTLSLDQNDRFIIYFSSAGGDDENVKVTVRDVGELSVSYVGKNSPVNIDVFTPNKLLTSLLSKMGVSLPGELLPGNTPIPHIAAAESIRGMTDAKVHTSFSKFCEFAKAVLGYDYEISGNKVVFRHVSSFFDSSQLKALDYVNNMELSVDESMIYSGVDVGFEKKEYDEINGRDEFHTTSSFSTGVNVKDNVMKLISPYRADHYGVEFLANKRNEDTKDDSSDNDLFILDAKVYDGKLVLRRVANSGASLDITGVLFPQSVFNVVYSPRNMLISNKDYLAACTDYLSFTASDGNSSVMIAGVPETQAISMGNESRIFRVESISVDTVGLSPFPGEYKGVITFDYAGRTYSGWVKEITEKTGKKQTTSYNLLCSKIT